MERIDFADIRGNVFCSTCIKNNTGTTLAFSSVDPMKQKKNQEKIEDFFLWQKKNLCRLYFFF